MTNATTKTRILPGETGTAEMPYSEVMMHMRIAGQVWRFRLLASGMVQVQHTDDRHFSFPVTAGEAGVYRDGDGTYFYAVAP